MNSKISLKLFSFLFVMLAVTALFSCNKDEDERIPPTITLESGAGYTNADATVALGDSIHVKVDVVKTEDELNTFDVSVFYDGATTSTSIHNEVISGSEQEDGFDRDLDFAVRNQAGSEKYVFTVTDRDGNIATATFTLTVQ